MSFGVLILGGTSEARLLAEALARDPRFAILLSFAGRTESLVRPDVPHRVGGFGGPEGLSAFLRAGGYRALIDATHAFAAQISRNAAHAAQASGLPLLRLVRPPWQSVAGDLWREVSDMQAAARALGESARRVFLSIGRLEVEAFCAAPQHDYLLRAVEPFAPPAGLFRARVIAARGPFALADERALFERERIECLVSKNAGTPSTYAKIEAARALGLPVVMVRRPALPPVHELEARGSTHECDEVATHEAALAWLTRVHDESLRGV
jgi:precorrin-6A/cobalt-precorrin-6A reductase